MLLLFKKSECAILAKYCSLVILNNLSVFEFVIHDHISHYLQFKINCCQHSLINNQSTTYNLVTSLDCINH